MSSKENTNALNTNDSKLTKPKATKKKKGNLQQHAESYRES